MARRYGANQMQSAKVRVGDGLILGAMRMGWLAVALLVLATAPGSAQETNAPAGQKVIQNQAEYDTYDAASKLEDPVMRGEAMDQFAEHYPHSVAYTDALEEGMAAWQKAGNSDKVEADAQRLVAAEPGNIRALAVVVALTRAKATQGDQMALSELCIDAPVGLRNLPSWQKPANLTDADFAKLRDQMKDIFEGGSGFCALQQKKYSDARDSFKRALDVNPASMEDMYQLAVADLEMTPADATGFWYCARALQLAANAANRQAANSISVFCKTSYVKYHGSDDGWEAILSEGITENAPPADFASRIKRGRHSK